LLRSKERVVNLKAFVFCAATAASAVMAGPAAAQWRPYGPDRYGPVAVSPYAITATLRAYGLRPVTQPLQTGRYIVVRAIDPDGQLIRVLINADYGNVVQVTPLPLAPIYADRAYRPYGPYPYRPYEGRPYEPDPRYGAARPDLKVEPAPLARNEVHPGPVGPDQRAVPEQRIAPDRRAMPEQRSASVTPPRTPLPRPRPPVPAAAASTAAASANAAPAAAPGPARSVSPPATTVGAAPTGKPADRSFPPAAPLE
jgi:hypothetical protein